MIVLDTIPRLWSVIEAALRDPRFNAALNMDHMFERIEDEMAASAAGVSLTVVHVAKAACMGTSPDVLRVLANRHEESPQ